MVGLTKMSIVLFKSLLERCVVFLDRVSQRADALCETVVMFIPRMAYKQGWNMMAIGAVMTLSAIPLVFIGLMLLPLRENMWYLGWQILPIALLFALGLFLMLDGLGIVFVIGPAWYLWKRLDLPNEYVERELWEISPERLEALHARLVECGFTQEGV